jgi:hypothetical protein
MFGFKSGQKKNGKKDHIGINDSGVRAQQLVVFGSACAYEYENKSDGNEDFEKVTDEDWEEAKRNEGDAYGNTLLHRASNNADAVRTLLAEKADPNIANKYGDTPLSWASSFGHTQVVKQLLKAKANPNIPNKKSHHAALHQAASKGHTSVVVALLANGADKNAADINGHTPYFWAVRQKHLATAILLKPSQESSLQPSEESHFLPGFSSD